MFWSIRWENYLKILSENILHLEDSKDSNEWYIPKMLNGKLRKKIHKKLCWKI